MQITDKEYKRYKRMAIVITSGDLEQAEDLLQDVLLKFCEKETENEKLTDNYVFISLKNKFYNNNRGLKNTIEYEDYKNLEITEENEYEDRVMRENEQEKKLLKIKENISKLDYFEKMLFELVVIKNIKQVRIAEKTGLSTSLISDKFKKIKNKLKQ
jgi:RNA polymerase sigma factor (sigma-70 family)